MMRTQSEMEPEVDFAEVLRRAHARCTSRPACLECVGEVTAELILETELGPAWREIMQHGPIQDAIEI